MSGNNASRGLYPGSAAEQQASARIYWYSAKHEVLTMHYCLEAEHDRLAAVRDWASNNQRDQAGEQQTLADADKVSAELNGLAPGGLMPSPALRCRRWRGSG